MLTPSLCLPQEPARFGALTRLQAALQSSWQEWLRQREWRQRQARDRQDLRAMDPAALRDLGLGAGEFDHWLSHEAGSQAWR